MKDWDEHADGWDANESVILYCQKAFDTLLKTTEMAGSRVLDFGCGTGLLTEKIAAHAQSVVSIDPSEKMISILESKKLHNVSTITSKLTQNVIDKNDSLTPNFDLVVASSSLSFVANYNETLLLLKCLLCESGQLVQWDWLIEDDASSNGFTVNTIEKAYANVGFQNYSTSIPFTMGDSMKVVMGVASNA